MNHTWKFQIPGRIVQSFVAISGLILYDSQRNVLLANSTLLT